MPLSAEDRDWLDQQKQKTLTPAAPPADTAPETKPEGAPADEDWQVRAGRGVAKSLAATATGIPRAVNAGIGLVSPSLRDKLGDLAEQVPGVKRMEKFAAEPSGSWAETFGNLGGEAAQLLAGPGELKWGARLASQFPKPVFAGGGRGFVAAQRPWLQRTGEAAEFATRGAAAGAMSDPENPGAGAVIGGATAGLAPSLGALARSGAGQYVGGQAARGLSAAAVTSAAAALGMPAGWLWTIGIPELLRFYHSPLGRKFDAAGRRIAERGGRGLERVDPRLPGAAAGRGEGALEPEETEDAR